MIKMIKPNSLSVGSIALQLLVLTLLVWGSVAAYAEHPGPQPRPLPSQQILSADGATTYVTTPEGQFEPEDNFQYPPGSNHLENVDTNAFDYRGNEMPNTLPSTPDNPYNLHPAPVVTNVDKTSPTDDLAAIFKRIREHAREWGKVDLEAVQLAIDILEGNPISDRVYSGFPLLHYKGPVKSKTVEPIHDDGGNLIGGNVNVHQIWYDSHIESDTGCLDPLPVWDVPWTITYTIDVLNRGHDDFAPFAVYFDDPSHPTPAGLPIRIPHVAMDQTFFPMEDGTRTVFEMKMSKGMYYNLTYHWGWRVHPPRVQVHENCNKTPAGKSILQWEIDVFGEDPTASEEAKLQAISMIGDLAPAKRMWNAMRKLENMGGGGKRSIIKPLKRAERAFDQWRDRTQLPDGVKLDPDSDVTLFYVNNTIYGRVTNLAPGADNQAEIPGWTLRPYTLKVHLVNGDYFMHAYTAADFGGTRGWENQFYSTIDIGGAGPWFTFGRVHWWMPAGAPVARDAGNNIVPGLIPIDPATRPTHGDALTKHYKLKKGITLGEHDVHITYNHEPSRRIKVYQFDPLHHDVAIWSMH